MNKLKMISGIMIIAFFLVACGKGTMEPTNESYEPRIVIEGYLHPGESIDRITITRNFRVNTDLSNLSLIPNAEKTTVQITDLAVNRIYNLDFKIDDFLGLKDFYWTYTGSDFVVQHGTKYQLDVWTEIDDKSLHASSITTAPEEGFEIVSINHTVLKYRERELNSDLKEFMVQLNRSPGTTYYVAAIQALNPSPFTYIFDNPYEDKKAEDVDLIDDALSYQVIHHTPETVGTSYITFGWETFRFYDTYRIIIYAADENYKDYFITYRNVMEMNGNFHEAKFNIDGDGIGVFGSIIADTVYCEVTK